MDVVADLLQDGANSSCNIDLGRPKVVGKIWPTSPGQNVYMYTISLSMPGKREAFGRCWFNVGPRRIDGRPALIRHWFCVLLGSLHNFTLFLTIYYSMLCFLDSVS